MKATAKRVTDWNRVLNAARMTAHLPLLDKEPTDTFKRKILKAEHSPVRLLEYDIIVEDVPYYVIMHLVRHFNGIEKFVATSREDRTGVPREERKQTDHIDAMFSVNAQAMLNISRVRLCRQASKETRELWRMIVDAVGEIDPIVRAFCVPNCVYRGLCPEIKTCGFNYHKDREKYEQYMENVNV